MNDSRIFGLVSEQARKNCAHFAMTGPEGWIARFSEPTRSHAQNAAQWPILEAFAKQLKWPVNGSMAELSADEWKDILTAAFQGDTVRLAMGLNGGIVMLGLRTSKMGKKQFSDWLEFLHATAALRGVVTYADGVPA
jgi:hypothetical protein